jgi:hypothetical protein
MPHLRAFRQLLVAGSIAIAIASCRPTVSLTAVRPTTQSEQVRISLVEIDNDILKFVIYNLTGETLVVMRDEIRLASARGTWSRITGGVDRVYNIPAGQAHDVNVRYDWNGVDPGETAEVRFNQALMISGHPIDVPPIQIRHD